MRKLSAIAATLACGVMLSAPAQAGSVGEAIGLEEAGRADGAAGAAGGVKSVAAAKRTEVGGQGSALLGAIPPTDWNPEPWKPFREEPFTLPAGQSCAFELKVEAVKDLEMKRVDERYPNGAEKVVEYKGDLIAKFTNATTGKSVLRDLSGSGFQELYPDGKTSKAFGGVGPFGVRFGPNDAYPQGYYAVDGVHVITWDPDGTKHMAYASGKEENVCLALS